MRSMTTRGGLRRRSCMPCQRPLHGVEDELVDRARIAETDFDFRRVHVHIDALRGQVEKQHIRRVAIAVQHVFVSGAYGVRQQLVAYEAAVDVKVLAVCARLGSGRQADEAVEIGRASCRERVLMPV